MMIKAFFVIALCLLLWFICYSCTGNDEKNLKGFRSYPKEVQEMVKKDPVLGSKVPKEASFSKVFISNLILFIFIFLIVGIALKYTVGFKGFSDAFSYFLVLGETMNLFDLLVIDLLWWRNSPRIRFSFAQDKMLYKNARLHIYSFLRGIGMYLICAFIVSSLLIVL